MIRNSVIGMTTLTFICYPHHIVPFISDPVFILNKKKNDLSKFFNGDKVVKIEEKIEKIDENINELILNNDKLETNEQDINKN